MLWLCFSITTDAWYECGTKKSTQHSARNASSNIVCMLENPLPLLLWRTSNIFVYLSDNSCTYLDILSFTPIYRCVGSCSPPRNALTSFGLSAGLSRSTRWPAPVPVTMVMPWYSTILRAICIFCATCEHHWPILIASSVCSVHSVFRDFRPACQGTRAATGSWSVGRAPRRDTESRPPWPCHPRRHCDGKQSGI